MTILAFPGGASILADRDTVVSLVISVQSRNSGAVGKVEVCGAGMWQLSSGRACGLGD